ncbi:MAG TPA: hypothetical protein EYO59_00510 [Chromatiaceae bacterium]|nr:hypothetical protein [Chromatiaceae bacterium]
MIEQWLATREAINSDTYDKEMQKKIIDSALGDISRDIRDLIHKEVEENELKREAEEQDQQKNSFGEKGEASDEVEKKKDEDGDKQADPTS